jgi:predicted transcriptional regulator
LIISSILLFLLPFLLTTSTGEYSNGNVHINKNPINNDYFYYSAAVDDSSNVYVVWNEVMDPDAYPRLHNLYIATSTDGGRTFSEKRMINDAIGKVYRHANPKITAWGNGNVHVAWLDERDDLVFGKIYHDGSTDAGMTFGEDQLVETDHEKTIETLNFDNDKNNDLYLSWMDQRNDAGDIFFKKIDSKGEIIKDDTLVNVNSEGSQQYSPSMAVSSTGEAFITWVDNEDSDVCFSKSSADDYSFSDEKTIISGGRTDVDITSIITDDENIYVFCSAELIDGEGNKVLFASSSDKGESWTEPINLATNFKKVDEESITTIVDSNGNVYVAWWEGSEGKYDLILKKSSNGGKSWSNQLDIGIGSSYSVNVILNVDSNNDLVITWADGREGDVDIYNKKMAVDDLNEIQDNQNFGIEVIIVSSIVLVSMIFLAIVITETGRYSVVKFFTAPSYSKIKKENVLDHNLRQQLLAHINAYPGAHFKAIQKTFKIGSGTLAYHLSVLEREEYIKSQKKGSKKHFYPGYSNPAPANQSPQMVQGAQVRTTGPNPAPASYYDQVTPVDNVQERILTTIRQFPGITQRELAEAVGLSDSGLNYHINVMASAGVIKVTRDGRFTRCFLIEDQ